MNRTLAEIAQQFDTDKSQSPDYISNFEFHFSNLRDKPITILELGVFHGGSLLMWHEYFSNGLVVGLDMNANPLTEMPERMRFYRGSQDDAELLDRMAAECAPDGFDIVIDDAAHVGTVARESFRNLFDNHLKPGGIYVVEDWGTGYWGTWPDGKNYQLAPENHAISPLQRLVRKLAWGDQTLATDPNFAVHNFGMVGFVKELVDEVAWPDITAENRGNSELQGRVSKIRGVTIYTGHAFVAKAQ